MPSALINGFDNADGLVEFGGELRLLARCPALRVNKAMRGRAVLLLLGLMTFGAYSVGGQSAPVSDAPVPAIHIAVRVGAAGGLYRPGSAGTGTSARLSLIERARLFHQGQLVRQVHWA
jgi:hypothetical protein